MAQQGGIDGCLHFLAVLGKDRGIPRITGFLNALGCRATAGGVVIDPDDLVAREIVLPALQTGGMRCNAQPLEEFALPGGVARGLFRSLNFLRHVPTHAE